MQIKNQQSLSPPALSARQKKSTQRFVQRLFKKAGQTKVIKKPYFDKLVNDKKFLSQVNWLRRNYRLPFTDGAVLHAIESRELGEIREITNETEYYPARITSELMKKAKLNIDYKVLKPGGK